MTFQIILGYITIITAFIAFLASMNIYRKLTNGIGGLVFSCGFLCIITMIFGITKSASLDIDFILYFFP